MGTGTISISERNGCEIKKSASVLRTAFVVGLALTSLGVAVGLCANQRAFGKLERS
jgi:hypothetical protein